MMRPEDLLKYVQNIELNLESVTAQVTKLKFPEKKSKAIKKLVKSRKVHLQNIRDLIAKIKDNE